jgi:hypothetical protein
MLYYDVRFGKNAGIRLTPHRFRDGRFRASRGKSGPHKHVQTVEELIALIRQGQMVRMSNPEAGHPPSLISPKSIEGWR